MARRFGRRRSIRAGLFAPSAWLPCTRMIRICRRNAFLARQGPVLRYSGGLCGFKSWKDCPFAPEPVALGRSFGRDHHPQAYTIWMAGGGLKRGLTYGATDELGFHVVENPVHVHDLQATILHLLGLDH